MSDIHKLKEAGIIVGEATSSEFYFASEMEEYPSKWEYLVVYSREVIDGMKMEVPVLAQVEKIAAASEALDLGTDIEALRRIKAAELEDVRTWGKARILGYLHRTVDGSTKILLPRRAVVPGHSIYVASEDLLRDFYSYPEEEGIHIGYLITRTDVPVFASVSGFRRHLAIIAQTGAGKSYSTGVLIEELIKKGGTVVVIDPHADYAFLSLTADGGKHDFSERITVFRNPSSTGRYEEKDVGKLTPYTIAFGDLSLDEVYEVAGIRSGYANIRDAVRHCISGLRESGRHYSPEDLLASLEETARSSDDKNLASAAASSLKYIRSLTYLRVFGPSTTPIREILKPMHASVVDLSGLDDVTMDYITSRILSDIYTTVADGEFEFPVFLVLEEAHKLIPPNSNTFSAPHVNRIAAEGRKFGVFLVLISQRPSKINPDSLSQCNSQIIMKLTNPQDQNAVASSSERISQDLLADLPGLNPGEAVIVGEITRAPVMVNIRRRLTKEGGSDIDVVGKLQQARRQLGAEVILARDKKKEEPFRGTYSEV